MRRLAFIAFSCALLAACGGDDGAAGADGGDCTATAREGGGAVVTCADGSRADFPADACSVEESEDGTVSMRCGETTIVVRRGEALAGGAIVGEVRLWGHGPIAGIAVEVEEASAETRTDEDGSFRLADLPPGLHRVRIHHEGYVPVEIPNVPVVGGDTSIEAVTLEVERLLGHGRSPVVSPAGDWMTFIHSTFASVPGELEAVDLRTFERRKIAYDVREASFLDDGTLLSIAVDFDDLAIVALHDLEAGEEIARFEGVGRTWAASGGVFLRRDGLDFYSLATRSLHPLGSLELESYVGDRIYRLRDPGGGSPAIFDTADQRLIRLEGMRDPLRLSLVDGVLYARERAGVFELVLEDLDRDETLVFAELDSMPSTLAFTFGGDGLIYWKTADGTWVRDIEKEVTYQVPANDPFLINRLGSSDWIFWQEAGGNRYHALGTDTVVNGPVPFLSTSASGRLVYGTIPGGRRAVWEVETDRLLLLPEGTGLLSWIGGSDRALVAAGGWISILDFDEHEPGEADLVLHRTVASRRSEEGDLVAFRSEDDGELYFLDLADGSVHATGVRGTPTHVSPWAPIAVATLPDDTSGIFEARSARWRALPKLVDFEVRFHPTGFLTRRVSDGGRITWGAY